MSRSYDLSSLLYAAYVDPVGTSYKALKAHVSTSINNTKKNIGVYEDRIEALSMHIIRLDAQKSDTKSDFLLDIIDGAIRRCFDSIEDNRLALAHATAKLHSLLLFEYALQTEHEDGNWK